MIALLILEISFRLTQCTWSQTTNVIDGQTDDILVAISALRTYFHRAVIILVFDCISAAASSTMATSSGVVNNNNVNSRCYSTMSLPRRAAGLHQYYNGVLLIFVRNNKNRHRPMT